MKYLSMLAVAVFATLVLTACSQENQTQTQTGHEGHEGTHGEEPAPMAAARHEIEANSEGYVPAMVHAKAGQEVTWVFTRTTDQTCATEVVMPSQEIEVDLPLNEPVEVTFTAGEGGEIEYSCGMNMWKGKVVVN